MKNDDGLISERSSNFSQKPYFVRTGGKISNRFLRQVKPSKKNPDEDKIVSNSYYGQE